MNANDMSKEVRLLEGRLRDLRNKNSDAQSESNRLFNEKISIQADTELAIKGRNKAIEDKSVALKELAEVREAIKKENFEIAKKKSILDQEEAKLKEMAHGIGEHNQRLLEDDKHLNTARNNLKDLEKSVRAREVALGDREALISNKEKEIDKMLRDVEKERFDVRALSNKVNADLSRVDENIQKSKDALSDIAKKTRELESEKQKVKDRWEELAKAEAVINQERARLTLFAKDTNEDRVKLNAERKSLTNGIENLKRQEDEFEIKRLRLEKAIRDEDVRNELARLRKDIEK